MANEAVLIVAPTKIYSKTVASGTAITKYTLMALTSDPDTITASAGNGGQVFGGIAMQDKSASDTSDTKMSVAQDGIFDLTLVTNGTTFPGDLLILSGTNTVAAAKSWSGTASALYLSGMIVGMALETGSSGEVIAVDIGRKN